MQSYSLTSFRCTGQFFSLCGSKPSSRTLCMFNLPDKQLHTFKSATVSAGVVSDVEDRGADSVCSQVNTHHTSLTDPCVGLSVEDHFKCAVFTHTVT